MSFKSKIYALYGCLVVTYGALTFSAASVAAAQKYGLSLTQYRLINLSVVIPYFLIWLAGFYGYEKLREYTTHVKKTKDGKHVNLLAKGIFMLVLWPPLSSIFATAFITLKIYYPATETLGVLVNEYFNLIWPLVGFVFLSSGARGLSELAKLRPSRRAVHVFALVLISLGVVYAQLVSYAYQQSPGSYHMPFWLVIPTLVVPYVYMWFIGLWATYLLYLYQRKVAGIIYRKSWRLLAYSVGAIIIMQIIVQYANTLVSKLSKLPIGKYVIIVYVVLILLAVGYVLLARGAKRLQKIEEV